MTGAVQEAGAASLAGGPHVLDSLSSAIAVADASTLTLHYENARFRDWFPPSGPEAGRLEARLPELDSDRLRARIERGRPYRFETEVQSNARSITVQVELRPERLGDAVAVLVEGQNISKQKEAEYMLDSYSRMVERQTRDLERENERVEKLLLNIMPRRVYEELKDSGTTTPQAFDPVSVLMLDFVDFTEMAVSRDPGALIAELNDIFTSFDRIVEHFQCERIKTIGDAYMAVAGLPDPDPDHAVHLARAALRMRRFMERRNTSSSNQWQCRIGIGCGPVIGSIVGIKKYVYDIFGPAVNLASRLEALGGPMQILVCASLCDRIQDEFVLRRVGEADVKGFGVQEIYELEDERRPGR